MDEPESPKLTASIEILMNSTLFKHLSDERQNKIIMGILLNHDAYAGKVQEYYEKLKP